MIVLGGGVGGVVAATTLRKTARKAAPGRARQPGTQPPVRPLLREDLAIPVVLGLLEGDCTGGMSLPSADVGRVSNNAWQGPRGQVVEPVGLHEARVASTLRWLRPAIGVSVPVEDGRAVAELLPEGGCLVV